jgi:SnoaL-like domain
MSDINNVVDSYIAMWNEPDADQRRALVAQTLTGDATYLDPLMSGAGTEEITAMIGAVQQQYAGHRFELVGGPDAHHDNVRFTWLLTPQDGEPIAIGVDFAELAQDGRLCKVTGFLEPTS